MTAHVDAQIFKKIKKRAEQAAERTILRKTDEKVSKKTGKTIDDATTKKDKSESKKTEENSSEVQKQSGSTNSALELHTDAKKAFYKEDVIIKMHENNTMTQTQYFDADEVAVRMTVDKMSKPGYGDSEGFMYVFDEKTGEYTKSSIVSLQSQGMMIPTMMLEAFKLPPEPFMASLQKQQDQGLTPNPFNGIVEFAFVYEPEQFRYEDFKESKQTRGGKSFTKFDFLNEPGFEGSYVIFDDQDRLVEIYTNKKDIGQTMDMVPPGESLILYEYRPVEVKLPPATEVKMQGQGMMETVFGSFKKDKNSEDIDDDDYDTSDSKGQVKSAKKALKNHKVTEADLPSTYVFDWIYETEMIMGDKKKDKMGMIFLIKEGATYQATQIVDERTKDMGNATMLFDADLNSMVMFIASQGNNFLQIHPIPEVKDSNEKMDFKISELPSKKILNFTCKGLQMEDDRYIIKVYHTSEAKVKLGNFMNFNGAKKMELPDIDPRILKQFSDGLIMEMHMEDKKKSKNNMVITAKALKKDPTTIIPSEYKSMDMFSGAGMMKN
jgi:hypothetical protein